MGAFPTEWTRFWHLADQEYLQGGGWVCIEEITGHLVVIDLDCPDPVHLLSSSVGNFYTILAHSWNGAKGPTAPAQKWLLFAMHFSHRIAFP